MQKFYKITMTMNMNMYKILNWVIQKFLSMKLHRISIKSSEIAIIFGISTNTAREWMRNMRAVYKKNRNQEITIAELCEYKGVKYKNISCQINNIKPGEYDKHLKEGFIEEPVIFLEET